VLVAIGEDHGVDADDLAGRVEERAAGVSGIDGSVSLNGVINEGVVGIADGADGTDDALGHGSAEAEGIADSEDALADLEPGGIGEGNRLQIEGLNFEQSEIVDLVDIEDGRRVMGLVAESDLDSAVGSLA